MNKYTLDYFIKKFSKIPKNKWCTGSYTDSNGLHCAIGHTFNVKGETSFINKLVHLTELTQVNDGKNPFHKLGKHPRTRVVNYLKSLKEKS